MLKLIEIHPRIFARGHTRNVELSNVMDEMYHRGIKTVFNVALIEDRYLAGAMRTVGMTYEHFPFRDSKVEPVDDARVREIARKVARATEHGGVIVHCDSGWNRSFLIGICAAHELSIEPTADIVARCRAERHKVLKNPKFHDYVVNYRRSE